MKSYTSRPGGPVRADRLALESRRITHATHEPTVDVDGDWPTYGNDPGGTLYSPLAQIDRGNVSRLRVAWTYRTGESAGTSGHVAMYSRTGTK